MKQQGKKKVVGLAAAVLAAGLCLTVAGPASAETHYPTSGTSFNRGNYWGELDIDNYSFRSAYEFIF